MRFPLVLRSTLDRRRAEHSEALEALDERVLILTDDLRRTEAARVRLQDELITDLIRALRAAFRDAQANARPGRHKPGVRERLRLEGIGMGLRYAERAVRKYASELGYVLTPEEEVKQIMDALLPEEEAGEEAGQA